MEAVRRLTETLVRLGAQHVLLFGSLATLDNDVGPDSDVDLVVIMPGIESVRFHKRLADVEEVRQFPYPLDIGVYSPEEWEGMQQRTFIRNEVWGRGVVLH